MKTKPFILAVGLVSVVVALLLPVAALAAIPEEHLCLNYWWRDATHPNCSLKEFCGGGGNIPSGVLTFETKAACQVNLSIQPKPTVSSDVSVSWPKRILLQVQEFFLGIFSRFFPSSQNTNGNVPTNEQQVYDCGGFMGTQCPSGYKCKILGGDAGTCVKQ